MGYTQAQHTREGIITDARGASRSKIHPRKGIINNSWGTRWSHTAQTGPDRQLHRGVHIWNKQPNTHTSAFKQRHLIAINQRHCFSATLIGLLFLNQRTQFGLQHVCANEKHIMGDGAHVTAELCWKLRRLYKVGQS